MSREAMSLKAQRQETGCDLGKCPLHLGVSRPAWALSSAGGRCLHTAEVTGSIPVAPTRDSPACCGFLVARCLVGAPHERLTPTESQHRPLRGRGFSHERDIRVPHSDIDGHIYVRFVG